MEENSIDKIIRESFKDRRIQASSSAWERLEDSLNENKTKNNKSYKVIISVAASIVLLLSAFLFQNTTQETEVMPEEVIVNTPVFKEVPSSKIIKQDLVEDLPVEKIEIASKRTKFFSKTKNKVKVENLDKTIETPMFVNNIIEDKNNVLIASSNEVLKASEVKIIAREKEKRIRINSEDLLFAVTHSNEEVKAYYAQLKLDRNDVLDSIRKELKMSNLKINPETILVEVERSIEDEEFKGNFMQKLKIKISDIAVAIADRNR